MRKQLFLFWAFSLSTFYISNAQNNFKIIHRIVVQGDGGWDYVAMDNANQHVFVSHGTQVNILDASSAKELAVIPNTKGVHGIAIANDLNKGFTSNGKDSSVTVFDLKTFATTNKIYVTGKNPDAILYDDFSHRIFTFNGKGKNATVIDAATEKVIGTIDMAGKPEFAVSNHAGKIYVNIENKNEVVVIDANLMKIEKRFSIAPGDEPSGLAMDVATNRLFSVCGNKMLIVSDALNGKVVANLPIGDGADAVVFDEKTKNIFASNGEGTLTIVHEDGENAFRLIKTIQTQKGARTLALNPTTHHLFLPVAEFEQGGDSEKKHKKIKPNSFEVLEMGE